ncbi:MAG: protein kinase domain-containing protein [Solirubrobacterales bacterium]
MVGERILDRFTITERLGAGGFGTVWRAWDERLERDVAVKVLEGAGQARAVREARAAARLSHPGIVTLYEMARQGGRTFLVSELVEGHTVSRLRDESLLADRDVAEMGATVAAALDHAHARGVVHRDVKPENIAISFESAEAKLMDFGIARMVDRQKVTTPGDVVGTVAYMAPEQAEGAEVGPPADVYSLALSAYELWAGAHPFAGRSAAETARKIGKPVASLGEARPDLPAGLIAAIDAALAAEPEHRPEAVELRDAFSDSLPLLDDAQALSAVPVPERVARAMILQRHPGLRAVLGATAVSLLAVSALGALGGQPPALAWAAACIAGPLWAVLPGVATLAAIAGLVGWALADPGEPGLAVALSLVTTATVVLAPRAGRGWILVPVAPALGLMGLAPLFPAIAGLATRATNRAGLAAAGFVCLVVAEPLSGRRLLFGAVPDPPQGWQTSVLDTLVALEPSANGVLVLGAMVWVAAALAVPWLVGGRGTVPDLLGALVWGAALIAGHRLVADAGLGLPDLPPAPVLALALAALVPAALWRRARALPTSALVGHQAGSGDGSAYD